MVRALGDVTYAEPECSRDAAEAGRGRLRRGSGSLLEIQLIDGLVHVAVLRGDADIVVSGNQAVDQVNGDAALVMIFKDQPAVDAAARRVGGEFDLNFANPLPYLLQRGEAR